MQKKIYMEEKVPILSIKVGNELLTVFKGTDSNRYYLVHLPTLKNVTFRIIYCKSKKKEGTGLAEKLRISAEILVDVLQGKAN